MTLTIGTRGSMLATTQAGHVRDALIAAGYPAELTIISTPGDRSQAPVERIGVGVFTQALREALRLRREAGGPQDALAWYAQSEWGRALLAQGHVAQAETVQREALAQMQRIMGADAYQLTFVLRALSDTCMSAGRPGEAAALRGRARELAARRYAPGHSIVLQFRLGQAEALLAAGDPGAALAELQAILAEPEQDGTRQLLAQARELQAKAQQQRR